MRVGGFYTYTRPRGDGLENPNGHGGGKGIYVVCSDSKGNCGDRYAPLALRRSRAARSRLALRSSGLGMGTHLAAIPAQDLVVKH